MIRFFHKANLRARIRFRETLRVVASLLFGNSERIMEYSFARRHMQDSTSVLEIGCSDSSLALQLAKQGHEMYATDIRKYPFRHIKLNFLKADARNLPFLPNSFDVCLCVSTIEHVGQGQYGDHRSGGGDLAAIREMIRAVKQVGKLLLTTTYAQNYRNIAGRERYYDDVHLERLISGLKVEVKEYYVPLLKIMGHPFRWTKVSHEIARGGSYLRISSRATACFLLSKS